MLHLLRTTPGPVRTIASVSEYVAVFTGSHQFVFDAHHCAVLTVDPFPAAVAASLRLPACLDKNLPPRLWLATADRAVVVMGVVSEGQLVSAFNVPLFMETYPPGPAPRADPQTRPPRRRPTRSASSRARSPRPAPSAASPLPGARCSADVAPSRLTRSLQAERPPEVQSGAAERAVSHGLGEVMFVCIDCISVMFSGVSGEIEI